MPLEFRELGHTGLRISSISLGCVTFGREIDASASFDVLDRALERGITLLDTAAIYGNGASEEVIGLWMKERRLRPAIVLATKASGRLSRDNISQSIEGSLRRLGVDQVDLLQAHEWDPQTPLEETLESFDTLVRQGKVRFVGCSNWNVEQVERAAKLTQARGWAPIQSVQPIYNMVDRSIEEGLLARCAESGIGVITYSPLGAGFLTGKYQRDGVVPPGARFDIKPGHQRIYFTDHGFRVVESLRQLAAKSGKSMSHLAMGWALRRPGVTSVLIGARHPDQVDQAFHALDDRWDESISARLDEISSKLSPQS